MFHREVVMDLDEPVSEISIEKDELTHPGQFSIGFGPFEFS